MFGRIAPRYDLANLILSGGMSRCWQRALVRQAVRATPPRGTIADLATGSGDVALALACAHPTARVRGLDFCEPMLAEARRKLNKTAHGNGNATTRVEFGIGDCMALPLADATQDTVTIAYGVRNFQNRARGLREIHRVLREGGTAFILEFTQPPRPFRPAYYVYLRKLLPTLARLATGNRDAYEYLVKSIAEFPGKEAFADEIRAAGFSSVRAVSCAPGVVAIHRATKDPR
jgi:demethylmenaquinone methyltransferase/2-methoxy-6-polyprenyl-1,4-benzoquinol methylase